MERSLTTAAKVRRAFKAGRPRQKDLLLTPLRSILEGSIILHEVQNAMAAAGLAAEDVQAALILVSPEAKGVDMIYVLPIPETADLANFYSKVKQIGDALPLGVAVRQIDREAYDPADPESGAVVWVQPWLTGARAVSAQMAAKKLFASSSGGAGESRFN